jgi:hypothetical protein
VAGILAKGVAEDALNDPVVRQAAADIYLPTAVRKLANKAKVVQKTVEHMAETQTDGVEAKAPEDDWMNAFARFAEDASSERLQDLFGRILAGEIVRPGSFSLATVRTVAELDRSIAEDFSLIWAKSVGEAVDDGPEFERGEWFSRWRRLAEFGLMAPNKTAQYLPAFNPVIRGNAVWSPMAFGDSRLLIQFTKDCRANWVHIGFTRIGRQIGSILAPPDFRENLRVAGRKIVPRGVV